MATKPKYTKAERHEIYKEALNNFDTYCFVVGLCYRISMTNNEKYSYEAYVFPRIYFPEFWSFSDPTITKKEEYYNRVVFPEYLRYSYEEHRIRKTILEFCIEMTKPTKKEAIND